MWLRQAAGVTIHARLPLLDEILSTWAEAIGADHAGYRNHVYRVVNFCLALRVCSDEERRKVIVAACFHDLGIWSDRTVDYLPPSIARVRGYLHDRALDGWLADIEPMIAFHHQLTTHPDPAHPLIEVFRRADLVDVSLGVVRFGLPRSYIARVRTQFPNAGFHRRLVRLAATGVLTQPLRPLPFFKW